MESEGASEEILLQQLWSLVKDSSELRPFSEIIDDRFLLHFVRGKKNDVSKAFSTVKNYFSVRRKYGKVFKELDPQNIPMLETGTLRVLKNRDAEGRVLFVFDSGIWDPVKFSLEDFVVNYILLAEELWSMESFERKGVCIIFDTAGLSLAHTTRFTPLAIKQAVSLMWNSFPLRFKGVYMVNTNWVLNLIMKVAIPFLPQKIKERLHFLRRDELSKLHEIIDSRKLPISLRSFEGEEEDPPGGEEEISVEEEEEDIWDDEVIRRVQCNGDFYRRMGRCL